MNSQNKISIFVKSPACAAILLLMLSLPCGMAMGGEAGQEQTRANPQTPLGEINAAEGELKQAARELSQGEGAFNSASQHTGQTTWSQANGPNAGGGSHTGGGITRRESRANALQGSPESGYAGTWTDPATGDIITSVIAPAPRQNPYDQDYPIIIEPQVSGGNWGSDYGSGWQSGWPQWGDYPGEPAYGTTPPPFPPYGPQGPGFNSPGPGFNPPPPPPPHHHNPGFTTPPGMNNWPPNGIGPNIPPHPGYRPLRPNPPPPGFVPGGNWQPGANPPNNPGGIWHPGMTPPNNPGFQPPLPNPGWHQPSGNPGFNPGNPGFMPSNPPGWRPLPMRPGGGGWNAGPNPGIQPRRSF